MKINIIYVFLFCLALLNCEEGKKDTIEEPPMEGAYVSSIEQYRTELMNGRKSGYLQLVGLMKMDDDNMRFGKDSTNYLSLKAEKIPEVIGTFSKRDSLLVFSAEENIEIKNESDSLITYLDLELDEFGNSPLLFHETLKWQVITRNNQPYLRVWDSANPEIEAFKGFESYKLNPDLILEGDFKYYETAKKEQVKSQLGPKATTEFIGEVTFNFNGEAHSLDVGNNGFTMVADKTTGNETYGGGRYMYLDLPKQDGKVVIDFNKLYNPPCSFSEFTTCNYPPQQNELTFSVNAGEKIAENNNP